MKRKIIVLTALAIYLITSTGYAVSSGSGSNAQFALEKVDHSIATVNVSRLNVREGPSISYPSICKLEEGQAVTVMGKLGDWYAIFSEDNGIVGAVDGRYIDLDGHNAVTVAAKPAKEAPPILSEDEQVLLDLVNRARTDKGLEGLLPDTGLMKVARTKAKDMNDNGYFSHQSPTYGSPFDMMRQFNNTFKLAGENIAGNKTVEGAFKAWMSSDSHKDNILNSGFKITGIGVESSKTYGKILVQQFIGH